MLAFSAFVSAVVIALFKLSSNAALAQEGQCGSIGLAVGSYTDIVWLNPPPIGEGVSFLTLNLCRNNGALSGSLVENYIVPKSQTGINPEFCDHYDDNIIVCISNDKPASAAMIDVSKGPASDGSNVQKIELPGIDRPVHVATLSNGIVASASYGPSTFATFDPSKEGNPVIQVVEKPTELATMELGNPPFRQEKPHPHQILETEDGHILIPDLGTDSVYRYSVSADGALTEAGLTKTANGAGPRHAALGVNGKAYVVGELDLTLIEIGPQCSDGAEGGASGVCKVVSLPQVNEATGSNFTSAAGIRVSEDKKYVYVSVRTEQDLNEPGAIVAHALGGDGSLGQSVGFWPTGGPKPRDFNLIKVPGVDGEVIVVGNRKNNAVDVFEKDYGTGFMGAKIASLPVGTPTSILPLKMLPVSPEPMPATDVNATEPAMNGTFVEENDSAEE